MMTDDVIDEIINAQPVPAPEPAVHERVAGVILQILHAAEDSMIGKRVKTTHGYDGVIYGLHVDSVHGLTYTLDRVGPIVQNYYPVSTIREIEQ